MNSARESPQERAQERALAQARTQLDERVLIPTSNNGIYESAEGREQRPCYFTKALDDLRFYREYRVLWRGEEYRYWNPHRSKWGIHITRNLVRDLVRPDISILYLGAATGSSVSHLADVVVEGSIYAVEFSAISFGRLRILGERRSQVFPLLFDASRPGSYQDLVPSVDLLYMDISQPNQFEIFKKNAELFLKESGTGLFVLKERSISISKKASVIQETVERQIPETGMVVVQKYDLLPYDKDHMCYVIRKETP